MYIRETENYAHDCEIQEEETFSRELVQQCESLVLDENESLVSVDEGEQIETEEVVVEAPAENSESKREPKPKQSRIAQFFVKSDS